MHLCAAKRILKYVAGTKHYGIWYDKGANIKLIGFSDSDWASCVDDRKSISAYAFSLGSGVVSWCSKKQSTVALSSTEAEYISATATTCQAVWLRRVLEDLGLGQSYYHLPYFTNNCDFVKRTRRGTNSEDFISGMPDEILILVLSLLSIKDAVITSILSPRWRFLWTNLQSLNFASSGPFEITAKNGELYFSEHEKYYKQVYGVIRSYNHPTVHFFQIHFHLNLLNCEIDDWLEFAANRKVEILEMYLETTDKHHPVSYNYYLPIRVNRMTAGPQHQLPYSDFVHLKKLYLKNVNVSELALRELLKISMHLEMLSIHRSRHLTNIRVCGQDLNLKHFEIVECPGMASIYLSDFNLESFTYMGGPIDFSLTRLPNLKNVVMSQGHEGLNSNMFSRLSSCASSLQDLSLKIYHPMISSKLVSVCQLLNVKKLTLAVVALKDNCLLEFAPIINVFPNLETFTIELLWSSPTKRRREAIRIAADHPHEHLKVFKILGYYGRISDLELAAYIIDNSNALKKIVIDPRCQVLKGIKAAKGFKKNEEAARSLAQRQLPPLLPPGVELVIL
ncbi:putative F-box/FBD/LRR-repeat protein At4g13965 [Bidens hawaiensis]|uniref:putative F-box/FBD/LRR-repeat protein At4g13965 n=1 Tax=Bidens hawaiensis TaxID=980011 RepID=UPI00404B3452